MTKARTSEFRDPIHGFIGVYSHERRIIDTIEFQRLRRIHQLGLTHYIYHGAEHSRFGHSIGVMHLAGSATENLIRNNVELVQGTLGWTSENIEYETRRLVLLARLAGLVHDIGHAPFSHTGEDRLFPEESRHENHGAEIIKKSDIGNIIDSDKECQGYSITKEDVVDLVVGKATLSAGFVQELIDSPWDVDKMDYLLRDSHYCGVQYGTFDIERVLNTLTLDVDNESGSLTLAIEEGGLHALEAFVLARYYMFTQIYFHRVRRAFDLVLTDFIAELLQDKGSTGKYPGTDRIPEYLKWDDNRVLYEANTQSNAGNKNLAWRIVARQHPKAIYETGDSPDVGVARKVERELLSEIQGKFPGVQFWLDKAVDHPDRFRVAEMMVKLSDDPPTWREFRRLSRPLRGLQEIGKYRLYADVCDNKTIESDVREFCRTFMAS